MPQTAVVTVPAAPTDTPAPPTSTPTATEFPTPVPPPPMTLNTGQVDRQTQEVMQATGKIRGLKRSGDQLMFVSGTDADSVRKVMASLAP